MTILTDTLSLCMLVQLLRVERARWCLFDGPIASVVFGHQHELRCRLGFQFDANSRAACSFFVRP
jgi:ABC-type hemin transport system ATPase subunit